MITTQLLTLVRVSGFKASIFCSGLPVTHACEIEGRKYNYPTTLPENEIHQLHNREEKTKDPPRFDIGFPDRLTYRITSRFDAIRGMNSILQKPKNGNNTATGEKIICIILLRGGM